MKKFFFNKIEKNKITNFNDLILSILFGGLKIIILLIFYIIIVSFIFFIFKDFENKNYFMGIISSLIFLLILIYIVANRIPNQIIIFKNYFNTNKDNLQENSKIIIQENITKFENLNFDDFKDKIYFKNGKKKIHYSFDQLKIKGNLYTNDLIWFEGLKNWTKVSLINELSSIALSEPPLTKIEKNILYLKNSLKPSLLIYLFFSLLLGVSAGFLEKNKYDVFFNEVNKNSKRHQIEDEKLRIRRIEEFGELSNNFNDNKRSLSGYSDVHHDEIFATNDDGTEYSRWTSYANSGSQEDSEHFSYEETYRFLFTPYKTFFETVNLSNEEIKNLNVLLFNFTYSALITNLIFLPFLILIYFFKKRKAKSI